MRSCFFPSSLRVISRAAWRRAVAGTPSLTAGSHHQQHNLPLRPPEPSIALGLAERFFSATNNSAAKKSTPVDSASGGDPMSSARATSSAVSTRTFPTARPSQLFGKILFALFCTLLTSHLISIYSIIVMIMCNQRFPPKVQHLLTECSILSRHMYK
jgi:hypothetical protein